jgi:hypothetical protein
MEERGLKISRKKTEYVVVGKDDDMANVNLLNNEELKKVNSFKDLGSHMIRDGSLEYENKHRIQSGWRN